MVQNDGKENMNKREDLLNPLAALAFFLVFIGGGAFGLSKLDEANAPKIVVPEATEDVVLKSIVPIVSQGWRGYYLCFECQHGTFSDYHSGELTPYKAGDRFKIKYTITTKPNSSPDARIHNCEILEKISN